MFIRKQVVKKGTIFNTYLKLVENYRQKESYLLYQYASVQGLQSQWPDDTRAYHIKNIVLTPADGNFSSCNWKIVTSGITGYDIQTWHIFIPMAFNEKTAE